MPYRTTKDLNPHIREAIPSERGREIFKDEFNRADRRGLNETSCFKVAWAVLKRRGYTKNSKSKWVKK